MAVCGRVSFSVCRSDRAQLFQSLRVWDNRTLEKRLKVRMVKLSICIFSSGKAPFLNRAYQYANPQCSTMEVYFIGYVYFR